MAPKAFFRRCQTACAAGDALGPHESTLGMAARSTSASLSPCRYLHEPKARFPVGRLIPLAEAGISPAGSVRLILTPHSAGTDWPGSATRHPLRRAFVTPPVRSPAVNAKNCILVSSSADWTLSILLELARKVPAARSAHLYRQAKMLGFQGMELDRSTLAFRSAMRLRS
jgi:hypothetical protein